MAASRPGRRGPVHVAPLAVRVIAEALEHRAGGVGDGVGRSQVIGVQVFQTGLAGGLGAVEGDTLVTGKDIVLAVGDATGLDFLVQGAKLVFLSGWSDTILLATFETPADDDISCRIYFVIITTAANPAVFFFNMAIRQAAAID